MSADRQRLTPAEQIAYLRSHVEPGSRYAATLAVCDLAERALLYETTDRINVLHLTNDIIEQVAAVLDAERDAWIETSNRANRRADMWEARALLTGEEAEAVRWWLDAEVGATPPVHETMEKVEAVLRRLLPDG